MQGQKLNIDIEGRSRFPIHYSLATVGQTRKLIFNFCPCIFILLRTHKLVKDFPKEKCVASKTLGN